MLKFLLFVSLFSYALLGSTTLNKQLYYSLSPENLSLNGIKKIDNFKKIDGENFGIRDDYCYLKLELFNQQAQKIKHYFEFKVPFFDTIELYDEDLNRIQYFGQLHPFRESLESSQNVAFKVAIDANSKKTLYLKIQSTFALKIFLEDFSEEEYYKHVHLYKSVFIFVYGVFAAMLLYNSLLFFFIGGKSYLYYVLFHLTFFTGVIAWTGFGFEYLWPKYPIINHYTFSILGNIVQAFNILMIIHVVDLNKISPQITRVMYAIAGLFFLSAITSLSHPFIIFYGGLGLFTSFYIIGALLYILYLKFYPILFYTLLAKLFLIVSYSMLVLSEFHMIEGSFFIEYGYVWGGIVEVMLMSFVIMYRYKNIELAHEEEKRRRAESENILLVQHKLSLVGVSFNALVHQWRQPFSMINSIVFKLFNMINAKEIERQKVGESLESIEDITRHMSQSINDFRNMFVDVGVKESVNIRVALHKALDMLQHSTAMSGIEIVHSGDNFEVELYTNDFFHLLTIALNNAVDAIHESQRKEKTLELIIDSSSKTLQICDSGNGLSEESEVNYFKLFHTTKSKEKGTGVGLYIAKVLAQSRLFVQLDLYNVEDGCCFEVKF